MKAPTFVSAKMNRPPSFFALPCGVFFGREMIHLRSSAVRQCASWDSAAPTADEKGNQEKDANQAAVGEFKHHDIAGALEFLRQSRHRGCQTLEMILDVR